MHVEDAIHATRRFGGLVLRTVEQLASQTNAHSDHLRRSCVAQVGLSVVVVALLHHSDKIDA